MVVLYGLAGFVFIEALFFLYCELAKWDMFFKKCKMRYISLGIHFVLGFATGAYVYIA